MRLDPVWLKQLLLVGAVGLAWPWVFRTVMALIVSREGEALPGPRWSTVFLSLALATLWPLFGEAVFFLLTSAGLPLVARPLALGLMGLLLGLASSFMPYTERWLCLAGGLVFGIAGGILYPLLPWPYSALLALTLAGAGPMLGLTSPGRAKWKAMTARKSIYGWRGRIG